MGQGNLSTSMKLIDGVTYVRLMKKSASQTQCSTVYTLGVEEDHSYSVEGLLCENCYLLDSPLDSLEDIYKRYSDIALLSKFAGGIGVSMSRIRGRGALIKGTNGKSNGLVPWAHTLSASVASVNQGGKRRGAAAVYLEPHHPDIMQFLELKDNTGEREQRAYNLNLANWVSDLFMKRVKADGKWSLFDPTVAPELVDLYGDAYEKRYLELEAEGKFTEQIPARKVYARMMRTLAETGNGWMTFKDTANKRGNQVNDDAGTMIHLSNLCVEVLEATSSGKRTLVSRDAMSKLTPHDMIAQRITVTGFNQEKDMFEIVSEAETAVCNLGSINIGRGYVKHGKLDKEKLRKNVAVAVKYLDRVIDRNFYPIQSAHASNSRWRPVGLGLMGFADFLMQLRIPFESQQAVQLSAEIQEEIYYQALKTSCELAQTLGKHGDFHLTRAAKGDLQFDLAGVTPADTARWDGLKAEIMDHGLRNSLLIAIAPTACQVATNVIRTANDGMLSLYDILDANGVPHAEIEDNNEQTWIPIKPLLVDTLDGPKLSDKIWFNGKQPTYEVTYEDGTSYEYTGNHELLVERDGVRVWTKVVDLRPDDDIVTI
jgi:ribonucleoside-diphosphate reductase alpha chain